MSKQGEFRTEQMKGRRVDWLSKEQTWAHSGNGSSATTTIQKEQITEKTKKKNKNAANIDGKIKSI